MELGTFQIEIQDPRITETLSQLTSEKINRVFQICERYGEEEEDEDHWYYNHAVQLADEILNNLPG